MKRIICACAVVAALPLSLWCVPVAQEEAPVIVTRDWHSRVLRRMVPLGDGTARMRPSEVTELASGLHRVDPATGAFVDASEELTLLPDSSAVVGQKSAHFVAFGADVSQPGAVTLVLPEGK